MRVQITTSGVNCWLSARDTCDWATRPRASWPCSTLRDRRVFAAFDSNGLCDLSIDGGRGDQDCDGHEFNAIVADLVGPKVPADHPCKWCFEQSKV